MESRNLINIMLPWPEFPGSKTPTFGTLDVALILLFSVITIICVFLLLDFCHTCISVLLQYCYTLTVSCTCDDPLNNLNLCSCSTSFPSNSLQQV